MESGLGGPQSSAMGNRLCHWPGEPLSMAQAAGSPRDQTLFPGTRASGHGELAELPAASASSGPSQQLRVVSTPELVSH